MIAIIDYGMGNFGSIQNMLLRIGIESEITSDISIIESAEKLILPGVGAFNKAMERLNEIKIIPALNTQVLEKKKPILGICLGMQLFSNSSAEGNTRGLGWIDAETVKFNFGSSLDRLQIPHMGWNTIKIHQNNPILDDADEESRYYFVHSYHVQCKYDTNVLATTTYGIEFHSAIMRDNIFGTQFHPEKSHKFGLRLLHNFGEF